MNTHDIELPPLPEDLITSMMLASEVRSLMRRYGERCASAAIEADRKRKGEVVVTKTPEGEIIAVTRQDDEGRILSVIAEADSKRRGEPEYLISACYFPHAGEVELSWERKEDGVKASLTAKVTPEQGK